jgi:hypothetical protein
LEYWNIGIMSTEKQWNAGILEYWNNGHKGTKSKHLLFDFSEPHYFILP